MNDKLIFRIVAVISAVVFLLVLLLNRHLIPGPTTMPAWGRFLPELNAILNGTCSVLLLVSLYYIRKGKVQVHKNINIVTFLLSAIFLLSYVLFHWIKPETLYGDANGDRIVSAAELAAVGAMRPIYFVILTTHIILATAVLPLVLISFYWGLQMQVEKHRKIVRWTFPIWLYVTVTGVIVYILISPYYHF